MNSATLAQALALQNEGRLLEALTVYRAVLEREPLNVEALHLTGLAEAARGDAAEAVRLIATAVKLQPANAILQANLGAALSAAGRHAEALSAYDRTLAAQPGLAAAHRGRGGALLRLARFEEAAGCFARALELAPRDDQASNGLGVALERMGRRDEARASFERAIALNRANVDAHHNLALMESAGGNHAAALANLERALALRPQQAALHVNRGIELLALGRPAEALQSLERALALDARLFAGHFQRGVALAALDRYEESLASFDQAVALNASSAEAFNNRGAVRVRLFQPAAALADFDQALRLEPNYADAQFNAGIALRGLGRYMEALVCIDKALAIRPDHPTATWMKAVIKLAMGEFREGWPLYEARLQVEPGSRAQRPFGRPRWSGEPLTGQTLLVYADQGLGDTLQFCRYVPLLEAMDARVVLEVQPVVTRLLASLAMRGTLIARGDRLPEFDLHCPLLSLPLALRTEMETIPGGVPYLHVSPEAVTRWRERLAVLPGFKVGLNWQGDPAAERLSALEARSFPLMAAAPLGTLEGVSFVSLQKGPGAAQRAQVAFGERIAQLTDPASMGPEELAEETAAILMNLDLLITADTALAHLAGALGVRVWVVLQAVPDWRWLIDRDDSPWYPTMRLFRQRTAGDWPEVFERVARELAALAVGA